MLKVHNSIRSNCMKANKRETQNQCQDKNAPCITLPESTTTKTLYIHCR